MGDAFFKYDATESNCQNFVQNVLETANVLDEKSEAFVVQDLSALDEGKAKTTRLIINPYVFAMNALDHAKNNRSIIQNNGFFGISSLMRIVKSFKVFFEHSVI